MPAIQPQEHIYSTMESQQTSDKPSIHLAEATSDQAFASTDDKEPTTSIPLKIEDWLTVVVMASLALITFANVLVRYFTDRSFAWTEEISIFLMIVLALVAGSAAVARNRHIRIEYFIGKGSRKRQRLLGLLAAAMVAVLFTLITILSSRMVWDDIRYGETSPGIGVPQWWYSLWLPLLSFAITLRALGLLIRQGRDQ
jgi:TRAP-type C4-dicarboxylate transport system permease small subunit